MPGQGAAPSFQPAGEEAPPPGRRQLPGVEARVPPRSQSPEAAAAAWQSSWGCRGAEYGALMAMDGYKGFLGLLVSALLVGFLSVIFTLIWVLHYREGLGWDGTTLEFNWHPVLMVTGFVFIQGIGTGHLLGGSGEGRAGRGPGLIALSRVGPTWASEGTRGAREARGAGSPDGGARRRDGVGGRGRADP